MIPTKIVERVQSAIGELVLSRRADEFSLRISGTELMTSVDHVSEDELGRRTCARITGVASPRILIGGLGFGFTLRAALDALPATAAVDVAEIVPELVEWNRSVLGHLAGHPIADPRVTVIVGDVARVIDRTAHYDAIILDVDNGPDPMHPRNTELYRHRGLVRAHRALSPGGLLAVWSSFPSTSFTPWLRGAGFDATCETVRSRRNSRHYIWFAQKR
jgi:spermidine synthase